MGGYYAYVQFPYAYTHAEVLRKNGRVGSEEVAKYLATELGVVCLPGSFFMPPLEDKVWVDIEEAGGGVLREDRWLRYVALLITFSIDIG
jgi:aspartate/methionine/tyrosine aminotransferase